jgi:general stress protein CsbA
MVERGWRWNATGFAVGVLPFVFFASAPLWQKGHPFDASAVRTWVNKHFGSGTYESYVFAVKPLLLLAVSFAILGATTLLASKYRGATEGAYVMAVFFLSAAAGTLCARALLRHQGCNLE